MAKWKLGLDHDLTHSFWIREDSGKVLAEFDPWSVLIEIFELQFPYSTLKSAKSCRFISKSFTDICWYNGKFIFNKIPRLARTS